MHQPANHGTHHRRHGMVAIFGIATLLAWGIFLWDSGRVGRPTYRTVHAQTNGYALQFNGSGTLAPGLDRVIIPIDAPARPADIGATDFTIEFWLRATPGANTGVASCGANDGWITANTVIDRDIFGGGDYGDFGIAVSGNVIAFGVSVGASGTTLCSTRAVVDGQWHHVAAVRRLSGAMQLFIDGQPAGSAQGAAGNASYRDGRSTDNPADPYLVFGAEKHDAGAAYPSFSGWLDEVRLSTTVRYTAAFMPPTAAFVTDSFTAGLYHFDEGPAGACTGTVLDAAGASGGPSNGVCAYGGSPAGPVYVTDTPFATVPPTATNTPAPPTATNTPAPPTATNTSAPPTATNTPSATTTDILEAPTATLTPSATDTPVPSTATNTPSSGTTTLTPSATDTPVPSTATNTPSSGTTTLTPSATDTPVPSTTTATPTPSVATATLIVVTSSPTLPHSPTPITTPGGTIPPIETSTPEGQGTPTLLPPTATPTLPPCLATPTPVATPDAALPVNDDWRLYLPFIQQEPSCASTIP